MDRKFSEVGDIKISRGDKAYMESGSWKCKKSPTGAHHWIGVYGNLFRCRWCHKKHKFGIEIPGIKENGNVPNDFEHTL